MHGQNSVLNFSSTPNLYETQGTHEDTAQHSRMDSRTHIKAKETQHNTEDNNKDLEGQTDAKIRASGLPSKQLTLVNRLESDRRQLNREEGWNGTSPHGPSHQGPRVVLVVHQEACGAS